jgi:hypothetical protein
VSRWAERAPSERPRSRGWGYAIDYVKEIAADQARIAHLSSEPCIRASRELLPEAQAAFPDFADWDVYYLITYKPEGVAARGAVFGLTLEDVRAWAYLYDSQDDALWALLGDHQPGDYARGKAIDARLGRYAFDVWSEADRRKALAKAKAALARHRRNAEKHGLAARGGS